VWFHHAIYAPGQYTGVNAAVVDSGGETRAIDRGDLRRTEQQDCNLGGLALNRAVSGSGAIPLTAAQRCASTVRQGNAEATRFMPLARIHHHRSQICSRELAMDLFARGYHRPKLFRPDALPNDPRRFGNLRVEEDPGDRLGRNRASAGHGRALRKVA